LSLDLAEQGLSEYTPSCHEHRTVTDLALVHIGGTEPEQDRFFEAAPELITALKETAG